MCEVIRIIIIY